MFVVRLADGAFIGVAGNIVPDLQQARTYAQVGHAKNSLNREIRRANQFAHHGNYAERARRLPDYEVLAVELALSLV